MEWDEDYWGYTEYKNRSYGSFNVSTYYNILSFNYSNAISSWKITGNAKNIGSVFLDYPEIIVNFYNANGTFLAEKNDVEYDIASGYTWDFSISYDGKYKDDISFISFEVNA